MSDSHVLLQNCTVRISTFYTHTQKVFWLGKQLWPSWLSLDIKRHFTAKVTRSKSGCDKRGTKSKNGHHYNESNLFTKVFFFKVVGGGWGGLVWDWDFWVLVPNRKNNHEAFICTSLEIMHCTKSKLQNLALCRKVVYLIEKQSVERIYHAVG